MRDRSFRLQFSLRTRLGGVTILRLLGPARIMTYWVPWAACPPLHPGSGTQAAAGTPIIGKAGLNRMRRAAKSFGTTGRRVVQPAAGRSALRNLYRRDMKGGLVP